MGDEKTEYLEEASLASDYGQVRQQLSRLRDTIDRFDKTYAVFFHKLEPILMGEHMEEKEDGDSAVMARDKLVPLAEDIRDAEIMLSHMRLRFDELSDRISL